MASFNIVTLSGIGKDRMTVSKTMPLVLMSISLCASANARSNGVVTAKVLDQKHNPISNAIVQLESVENRVLAGAIPECMTDKKGICPINDVQFGKYRVSAMQKSDDYPDLTFDLYGHGRRLPVAELTPVRPKAYVTLTIGPKAGVLVADVIDAITGRHIDKATVILRRVINPKSFVSSSLDRDSRVLIPPDEDILVEVIADGYAPWPASANLNSSSQSSRVRLRSGEIKEVMISLQPK